MKKLIYFIVTLFLCFNFSNCIAQKTSSPDDLNAKNLKAPAGKALIYVIRPKRFSNNWFPSEILCDNQSIGQTENKTYIYAFLKPGKHTIKMDYGYGSTDNVLVFVMEENKTYYIEQNAVVHKFKILNEFEGKKLLKKYTLSKGQSNNY